MRPRLLLWTISGKRALNIFGSDLLRLAVNVRYDGGEGNLRPTTAAAAQTVLQLIVEIVQYMLDSTLHDRDYEVRLLASAARREHVVTVIVGWMLCLAAWDVLAVEKPLHLALRVPAFAARCASCVASKGYCGSSYREPLFTSQSLSSTIRQSGFCARSISRRLAKAHLLWCVAAQQELGVCPGLMVWVRRRAETVPAIQRGQCEHAGATGGDVGEAREQLQHLRRVRSAPKDRSARRVTAPPLPLRTIGTLL